MKNLAISELIERLRDSSPAELVEHFDKEELREIHEGLAEIEHDRLDALCAQRVASFQAGPLLWATAVTMTENPKHLQQGLPFKSHFPQKGYFIPLFEAFQKSKRLFIPKTREMLTSWCCCVYATHQAQWHKAEVIVQTANEEKAKRLVEYCNILYRNQPDWLKQRHPLRADAALGMDWEDGGKIFGIPSGEDKVRMFHPTIMIFDEAAFLPGMEACYNAVNPVAGQIIAISSAGPGWFGEQCTV
jgi:hypothetical protein